MTSKRRSSATFASITAVIIIVLILTISAHQALAQTRYYAGYFLLYGYYGVSGKIYTIDPDVPSGEIFAQWVTILIDSQKYYWVQVGYTKMYYTNYELKFYIEVNDSLGHRLWFFDAPVPGVTYTYTITAGTNNGHPVWYVTIKEGSSEVLNTWVYGDPVSSDYLEALSETSTTSISIDGTHFSNLAYWTGRGFPLWFTHLPYYDSPYRLNEISDYEFTARGGG